MSAEHEIMLALQTRAEKVSGGHFTIMRFTTNWRVGFGTPSERCDICAMFDGKTFKEAADKALAHGDQRDFDGCPCHEVATAEDMQ